MANIKSAKRRIKKTKKKTIFNNRWSTRIAKALKALQKDTTKKEENVKKAKSLIDKAAQKGSLHKNKAARMRAKIDRNIVKKEEPKKKSKKKTK